MEEKGDLTRHHNGKNMRVKFGQYRGPQKSIGKVLEGNCEWLWVGSVCRTLRGQDMEEFGK